jgi:ubiquinone/menaquinone biosynthesis C-methylase UbiE
MLICPDCRGPLGLVDHLRCSSCGWYGRCEGKVGIYLSTADLKAPESLLYIENYDKIASDDIHSSIQLDHHVRYLAENLVKSIGDVRGMSVCDLGSGKGHLAELLSRGGAGNVTCIDVSMPYLKRLESHERFRLILANAEHLPFADEFDLVVATDVLEHVLNVGSFLLSALQALKVGGRIVLRVPYEENLIIYSPLFGCKYRFVHLRTFNKALLRSTLAKAGFSVEQSLYDAYWNYIERRFWSRGKCRRLVLRSARRFFRFDATGPLLAPIFSLKHRLARVFFIPTMLVVSARKTRDVRIEEYSGFQSVPDPVA